MRFHLGYLEMVKWGSGCILSCALFQQWTSRKKEEETKYKIFQDPIHGSMKIPPACVAIIDTPQFQRLRNIKQLGAAYYVYPDAAHNRFEHSLGVCHLAGQYVRILRENQKELGITDKDVLCVEIAGLCHDLGHGPVSHMFEGVLESLGIEKEECHHEKLSLRILDEIITDKNMIENGFLNEDDKSFIKEMIKGVKLTEVPTRGVKKFFLYEIVNNKSTGIDVDKWDYLARDAHHLGIPNSFDHKRYMLFTRVIEVDGVMRICTRDKESLNLFNLFSSRYMCHKKAYQHPVVNGVEKMMKDAFIVTKDIQDIKDKNGKLNLKQYVSLTDHVINTIYRNDVDINSGEAKTYAGKIIKRIFYRDLYTCVLEIPQNTGMKTKEASAVETEIEKLDPSLKGHFYVDVVTFDYGMKEKNPLEHLRVFSKRDLTEAKELTPKKISEILSPVKFKEVVVRVYSKNKDKNDAVRDAAEKWEQEQTSTSRQDPPPTK